jgi:hypothetical protein
MSSKGASLYQSPSNPGLAVRAGRTTPQAIKILQQYQQDESKRASLQAKRREQFRKENLARWEKDSMENFELSRNDLNKALNKQVEGYMNTYADEVQRANSENRPISTDFLTEAQKERSRLQRLGTTAQNYIGQLQTAKERLSEDKYGIYQGEEIVDRLSQYSRAEDGSINLENLQKADVESVFADPNVYNKGGLLRRFYDTLEEAVATEIGTESDQGILFDTRNKITFRGSIVTDDSGKPIRDDEGRLQPIVNNDTMAMLRDMEPVLYSKIKQEAEQSGEFMQEIVRRDLSGIINRNAQQEASRRRIPTGRASDEDQQNTTTWGSTEDVQTVYQPEGRTLYAGSEDKNRAPLYSPASYSLADKKGRPLELTVTPNTVFDLQTADVLEKNNRSMEVEALEIVYLPAGKDTPIPVSLDSQEELENLLGNASKDQYSMNWYVVARTRDFTPPAAKKKGKTKPGGLTEFARAGAAGKDDDKGYREVLIPMSEIRSQVRTATGGAFDLSDPERPSSEIENNITQMQGASRGRSWLNGGKQSTGQQQPADRSEVNQWFNQ